MKFLKRFFSFGKKERVEEEIILKELKAGRILLPEKIGDIENFDELKVLAKEQENNLLLKKIEDHEEEIKDGDK